MIPHSYLTRIADTQDVDARTVERDYVLTQCSRWSTGSPAAAIRVPNVCRSEWNVIPPERPQRCSIPAADIAA